jgi:hypothetical protein
MAIEEIQSNSEDFADQIPSSEKQVILRKGTSDDPVTFSQMDNNLEILRAKVNELIRKVNELDNS